MLALPQAHCRYSALGGYFVLSVCVSLILAKRMLMSLQAQTVKPPFRKSTVKKLNKEMQWRMLIGITRSLHWLPISGENPVQDRHSSPVDTVLFIAFYCSISCLVYLCLQINIYYKNKNWLQFFFIVKAAVLKQQISKFYPQIQRTEASDHIYFSQRPFITVKAIFCA